MRVSHYACVGCMGVEAEIGTNNSLYVYGFAEYSLLKERNKKSDRGMERKKKNLSLEHRLFISSKFWCSETTKYVFLSALLFGNILRSS